MQPSELDLPLLPFYQLTTNYSPALALQFKETSALLSSAHALPFSPLSAPSASPDRSPSLEAKACSLRVPLALEQLLVLTDLVRLKVNRCPFEGLSAFSGKRGVRVRGPQTVPRILS